MPAPVQVTGAPYAWTAGSSTAGTLYPSWSPPALVFPPSRIVAAPLILLRQSFDGGTGATAGATLSAANTDGPGSTPLNQVSIGASATAVLDATASDGTLGAQFTTPVTATTAYAGWTTAWATQTTTMMWADVRLEAAPTANLRVFGTLVDAATLGAIVVVTTTRQILIANSAGTTVYTSATNVVPLGQHFRLEFAVTHDASAGTAQVRLYNATGSAVADLDSGLLTGLNTGVQSTILRYGIGQSGANLSVRLDRLGGSNAIVWGQGAGGSSSVTADASLAVTATLSAAADREAVSGASLAATATLAAGATRAATADASLAATATLTAGGSTSTTTGASLAATATLTAGGSTSTTTGASLAATATLTAAGTAAAALLSSNTFDGGTDGTTITTGNSGGASGDPWTFVSIPATGSATYFASGAYRGGMSGRFSIGTTAGLVYAERATGIGSTGPLYFRLRFRMPVLPPDATGVRFVVLADSVGAFQYDGRLTNAGKVELRTGAGTLVGTSTATYAAGDWVDVGGAVLVSSATVGQLELKLYDSAGAVAQTITSAATVDTLRGGGANKLQVGAIRSGITSFTVDVDDVHMSQAGYPAVPLAGATVAGAASLAVTATLGAASALTAAAAASLAVTATLTAAGTPGRLATASLPVTATLTAGAVWSGATGASLPVTATLTAGAVVGAAPVLAAGALSVTATLAAAGQRTATVGATLAATATLTATAVVQLRTGATLAVTATLTTAGRMDLRTAAALAVVATLTADALATPAIGPITYRPAGGTTTRSAGGTTTRSSAATVRPTGTTFRPLAGATARA